MASIIARDGYLPRQLANRGDRLVFSNGILVLAAAAGLLIVAFGGVTTALIPLYAVGVFTGFTLSQAGMVRHHQRVQGAGLAVQGGASTRVGAVATGIVLLVVVVSKFTIGAWIPAVVIPVIVVVLKAVKRHYERVERRLAVPDRLPAAAATPTPSSCSSAGCTRACWPRSPTPSRSPPTGSSPSRSSTDAEEHDRIIEAVGASTTSTSTLQTVYSPYRELTAPVARLLDELDAELRQRHHHRRPPRVRAHAVVGAAAAQPDARCC